MGNLEPLLQGPSSSPSSTTTSCSCGFAWTLMRERSSGPTAPTCHHERCTRAAATSFPPEGGSVARTHPSQPKALPVPAGALAQDLVDQPHGRLIERINEEIKRHSRVVSEWWMVTRASATQMVPCCLHLSSTSVYASEATDDVVSAVRGNVPERTTCRICSGSSGRAKKKP